MDRPEYDLWSKFTETVKYIWTPGKTSKNEIMRGTMSSDRIKEVIEYGLNNKDSWGRQIVTEESLRFLYTYNKETIDLDDKLYKFIKETVLYLRNKTLNENPNAFKLNENGIMEEIQINCVDVDWLG